MGADFCFVWFTTPVINKRPISVVGDTRKSDDCPLSTEASACTLYNIGNWALKLMPLLHVSSYCLDTQTKPADDFQHLVQFVCDEVGV